MSSKLKDEFESIDHGSHIQPRRRNKIINLPYGCGTACVLYGHQADDELGQEVQSRVLPVERRPIRESAFRMAFDMPATKTAIYSRLQLMTRLLMHPVTLFIHGRSDSSRITVRWKYPLLLLLLSLCMYCEYNIIFISLDMYAIRLQSQW